MLLNFQKKRSNPLKNPNMNSVIIIGGNHHNTLGVIRAMGYKGVKPTVILISNAKSNNVGKSRYIKELIVVSNENDALDYLLRNKENNRGAVIIACSDGASSMLDLNRDVLKPHYSVPGSSLAGRVTSIMNKQTMSELGKAVGFTVPASWVLDRNALNVDEVTYPCITKPLLSITGQKSDIKICKNESELLFALSGGYGEKYQVQQFLDKDFEYQLIGLSLNSGEVVIIPGCSRCIRPCPGTNTGYLHYESLAGVKAPVEICKKFVREVGYSGLFSIEFLRDKKGRDYFMEMNFRNDGNAICVTASGTNLPYLWYLANSGLDYTRELASSTFRPVYVMPEFADFTNFVANGKISLWCWLCDLHKTDCFMTYSKRDPMPFLQALLNMILAIIDNKIFKRINNLNKELKKKNNMIFNKKTLNGGGNFIPQCTTKCYEISCFDCSPQYGYTNGRIAA